MLNSGVLVLNRAFFPVHVTSVRRAFCLLYAGLARAINSRYETFDFTSWSQLSVHAGDEAVGVVGRMIRVPRVIVLVAYDKGDDDYHIQIRENPTTAPGTDCMIVEIPLGMPTHVQSPQLRVKFQALRKWMRDKLKPSGGEFSPLADTYTVKRADQPGGPYKQIAAGIVTGIALDHTDWLGPTREHIGLEKGGIFRAGRPALCADRQPA